jgi:hypothetical protein
LFLFIFLFLSSFSLPTYRPIPTSPTLSTSPLLPPSFLHSTYLCNVYLGCSYPYATLQPHLLSSWWRYHWYCLCHFFLFGALAVFPTSFAETKWHSPSSHFFL